MRVGYRNILLVQLGDIGDVVLTTPTIRAVKETYPDARVSILVRKPFGNILLADPNLFEVVESEKTIGSSYRRLLDYLGFVRRLRKLHYDLVIDLRSGDRGVILSFCTGAGERVGRYCTGKQSWHNLLLTKTVRDPQAAALPVHPGADQSLRIVRPLGIDTTNSMPALYVSPSENLRGLALLSEYGLTPADRWVTLNPFSRWKYKEWNAKKWRVVIDHLWEQHQIPTVLIGSCDEHAAAAALLEECKGRVVNLAGKTTLGELSAIISMSTLHLGVDSAAPHIAAAMGTPTVTIHGPSDWRSWRISNETHRIVSSSTECVPCNSKGCDDSGQSGCLDQLETQAAIQAIEELLCFRGSITFQPV